MTGAPLVKEKQSLSESRLAASHALGFPVLRVYLAHVDVANSDAEAHNLLHLKLDCRAHLS